MPDLSNELGGALEIVRKDWDRLPNPIKFCYVTGIFVLLAGWLIKPTENVHNRTISLWLTILLLVFITVLPIIYWVFIRARIYFYRFRYPIKNVGKDFQFVNLGGAVHLIDSKRKQIRWVENPRTLYDLGYLPSVWTRIVEVNNLAETINADSHERNLSNYHLKQGLRTGGKPGEGNI